MKKLLVVIPFIPYPLNTGGNQGSFHMLNFVKDYFDTHVWFHINNIKSSQQLINDFSNALDNKVTIHYTANKIGRNFITARAIKRKFDRFFLKKDIQYQHNSILWGEGESGYADIDALEDIYNIIEEFKIDIVQNEYMSTLDFVYAYPKCVKTVFIHHELRFARQNTMMQQLDKCLTYDRYKYSKQFNEEITTLNKYDQIITMSDIDKDKLLDVGVTTKISSSPSFIPQPSFPDFHPSTLRLSYVASGGHYPNIEGLEWFINNVHPLLVKNIPNYVLDVCGPKWNVQNINTIIPNNINFKGFVKDLRTIIPGSIMIVPILSGSGMRMKILESVNNSVPFVSTSVGAEGLDFVNGHDCFITDSPETFKDSVIKLLSNKNLQEEFVIHARKIYDQKYSPSIQAEKRIKILNSLL